MNTAYVVWADAISALGDSIDHMWDPLCSGESAIQKITRFSTERIPYHEAACLSFLDHETNKNRICEIMRHPLERLRKVPEKTFVIWTGIKGSVDFVEAQAKTKDTLYLAKHYREWVCQFLGIDNCGMEVNAACASSTVGLAIAAQKIESGEYESVLVCGGDIVSRFIHTGFSALRALTPNQCRPFDSERDGLCLGDCGVAVLVTNKESARRHHFTPMTKLSGWGIANDANHITGPAKDGRGLIRAITSALRQANLAPEQVDAFCAHGTGTQYNDAMELTAIEKIFNTRRFPLFSVKGALGHTLGAAGALESAISIKAMSQKLIPPTVGTNSPEERALGRLSQEPQSFSGRNVVTTNSGFGGCNAALVFEEV